MQFEKVNVQSFFEKEDGLIDILKNMRYGDVYYTMDYSETEINKISKQARKKIRTKHLPDNVIAIVCIEIEKSPDKIEMIIKNYGQVSKTHIIHMTQKFKAIERNEILGTLAKEGKIQEYKINDPDTKTNKPKTFYKWVAD